VALGCQGCALKEYNLSESFSTKQLQNELSILAKLNHPCILQVLLEVVLCGMLIPCLMKMHESIVDARFAGEVLFHR